VHLVDKHYHVNGAVEIVEFGQVEALAFTSVLTEELGNVVATMALEERSGLEIREAPEGCRRRSSSPDVPTLTVSGIGQGAPPAVGCIKVGLGTENEVLTMFRRFVVESQSEDIGASIVLQLAQVLSPPSFQLALEDGMDVSDAGLTFCVWLGCNNDLEVTCDGLAGGEGLRQMLVCIGSLPSLLKRLLGYTFDREQRLEVSLRFIQVTSGNVVVDPVSSKVKVC
jgi:hypothetical protein